MRTIIVAVGIILMTVDGARAASPAPSRPSQRVKRVQGLTLDDVTFPNRALDKNDLTRWELLASGMKVSGWEREPWHFQRTTWVRDYRTSWRNRGGDEGKPGELHLVELSAKPYSRDRSKISTIELDAKWRPAGGGWGADFHCDTSGVSKHNKMDASVKRWFFYFRKYAADKPSGIETLEFFPGLLIFYDVRRYEGTTYDTYIAIGPGQSFCVGEATVRTWIESPQSLLKTGLAWNDQLGAEVEQQIRSGKGVRRAYRIEPLTAEQQARAVRNRKGGEPPMPKPNVVESDRPLSDAEKEEILRDARKQLAAQKRLLQDHHQEMHAALMKAFPLLEYLLAAKRP